MKFLIILAYCDRPNMVQFALDSIKAQTYKDFQIIIIDDSSMDENRLVLNNKSFGLSDPFSIFTVMDSVDDKIRQGGSRHGEYVNKAIQVSDADVALMLCDDDALMPNALEELSKFYLNNPVTYSYGHVLTYDPTVAKNYSTIKGRYGSGLNNFIQPINPFCKIDASQVSWRIEPYRQAGIKFPFPQTAALDAAVYQQMFDKFGPCYFNNVFVQYKGVFTDQLGLRKDPYRPVDKKGYDSALV